MSRSSKRTALLGGAGLLLLIVGIGAMFAWRGSAGDSGDPPRGGDGSAGGDNAATDGIEGEEGANGGSNRKEASLAFFACWPPTGSADGLIPEDEIFRELVVKKGIAAARPRFRAQLEDVLENVPPETKEPPFQLPASGGIGLPLRAYFANKVNYWSYYWVKAESCALISGTPVPDDFEKSIWRPILDAASVAWRHYRMAMRNVEGLHDELVMVTDPKTGKKVIDEKRKKQYDRTVEDLQRREKSYDDLFLDLAELALLAGRRDLVKKVFNAAERPIEGFETAEVFLQANHNRKVRYGAVPRIEPDPDSREFPVTAEQKDAILALLRKFVEAIVEDDRDALLALYANPETMKRTLEPETMERIRQRGTHLGIPPKTIDYTAITLNGAWVRFRRPNRKGIAKGGRFEPIRNGRVKALVSVLHAPATWIRRGAEREQTPEPKQEMGYWEMSDSWVVFQDSRPKFLAPEPPPPPVPVTDEEKRKIRKLIDRYADALLKGDREKLLNLYTDPAAVKAEAKEEGEWEEIVNTKYVKASLENATIRFSRKKPGGPVDVLLDGGVLEEKTVDGIKKREWTDSFGVVFQNGEPKFRSPKR